MSTTTWFLDYTLLSDRIEFKTKIHSTDKLPRLVRTWEQGPLDKEEILQILEIDSDSLLVKTVWDLFNLKVLRLHPDQYLKAPMFQLDLPSQLDQME